MAVVEALCDLLRQQLDLAFLGPLCLLVVEPGQHMLLVQALELLALAGDVGEDVGHLVRDVGPPRRQQVHLDHGVSVVDVVRPLRQEAAPVFVGREEHAARVDSSSAAAEAVAGGTRRSIPGALCRVVRVRLPV